MKIYIFGIAVHELLSCSDSSILVPNPTVCCWLGAIYAAFEHSIYLLHVIFFNLQGINLDKSRKLLSSYFVHALSSNYSETGTRMKYCVTLFFPNITLS